jgi:phospholipid/cholesterol/gamma-HCH transport system substrate-binding protein
LENRGRNAVLGAVALLLILAFGYGMALFLGGAFKPGFEVTANFARAGQLLRAGSDVKIRGVLVGAVKNIDITKSGKARIGMRIFPEQEIPRNVGAAIRAKTLFGEKFVELQIPEEMSPGNLREGDEIPESRTIPPFEVETILEKGVPIFNAIDPEAFGAALHALAEGFVGNEQALRNATLQSEKLLTETERTLPNLERNLVHLKNFAAALDDTDESFLKALDGLSAVGEAIRSHPEEFRRTVNALVPLAKDLGDVLTARQQDLADIAGDGRRVLDEVAERAKNLPHLVELLDSFLGVWILDLSEGPNWRIYVTDPPIVGGTPYPPGEEPAPRHAAIAQFIERNDAGAIAEVLRVILEAVPLGVLSPGQEEQPSDPSLLGSLR